MHGSAGLGDDVDQGPLGLHMTGQAGTVGDGRIRRGRDRPERMGRIVAVGLVARHAQVGLRLGGFGPKLRLDARVVQSFGQHGLLRMAFGAE